MEERGSSCREVEEEEQEQDEEEGAPAGRLLFSSQPKQNAPVHSR